MKRLKGFTLIEIITTMVLSSSIIAVLYLGYSLTGKGFMNYKIKTKKNSDIHQLYNALSYSFFNARMITGSHNNLNFDMGKHEVRYCFRSNYITRTHLAVIDTFSLYTINSQATYLDKEIKDMIDFFEFEVFANDTLKFRFEKSYGADMLMKGTEISLNHYR